MKSKILKIAAISLAGLVLLAALSAVIYCAAVGARTYDEGVAAIKALFIKENNVFYRKSYTVSDRKAWKKREVAVASIPGKELTNGQLQVGYWMNVYDYLNNYEYYASYAQLDYTQPLDEQTCDFFNGTWQQYLLDDALNKWHTYHAMSLQAKKEGVVLAETFRKSLDTMEQTMTEQAKEAGYASLEDMIQADMGPGCTFQDYYDYMEGYYLGYMYYTQCYNKIQITEEMIEAYFQENKAGLAENEITKDSGSFVDIRQIYIRPDGGVEDSQGNVTYTDEAWAAAKDKAEDIMEEWEAGQKTETAFAELAVKYSDNENAESDGGYIEGITEGAQVESVDEWCFNEARKSGDCEIIKTEYGYHLIYFVTSEEQWHRECRTAVESIQANQIMEDARTAYPIEIEYKKIVLGEVDFTNKQK